MISETRSRSADIDAIVSLRHQITLRPHTAQRAIWVVSELPQHEPLQRPTSNRVRALQAQAIIRLNDTKGPYTLPVFTARRRGCSIYTTRERGSYVRVRCLHYGKHCTQTAVVRTGINSTWVRHTIYRTSQSSFRSTRRNETTMLFWLTCHANSTLARLHGAVTRNAWLPRPASPPSFLLLLGIFSL